MRMSARAIGLGILSMLLITMAPAIPASARARTAPAASAADLVAAVNALRASHGLPAYTVSSILMGTAQGQADYMASSGIIQHTGPDGSRPYQRGLAAGYPLAGQIPPGFFSENIIGMPGMSPSDAVSAWTGDAPHLNTMLSPNLEQIGAGVATGEGLNYYVIDCARPTGSGEIPAYTPGASEAQFSASNEIIVPVTMSTPNANGDVIHEVQAGQSLWQIATTYGVHIVDIQRLNNLGNSIVLQQGDKLLIKHVATATAAPTLTATLAPETVTPQPTLDLSTPTLMLVATATLVPAPSGAASTGVAVGAIAVVALIAAALVAWAGRTRPI